MKKHYFSTLHVILFIACKLTLIFEFRPCTTTDIGEIFALICLFRKQVWIGTLHHVLFQMGRDRGVRQGAVVIQLTFARVGNDQSRVDSANLLHHSWSMQRKHLIPSFLINVFNFSSVYMLDFALPEWFVRDNNVFVRICRLCWPGVDWCNGWVWTKNAPAETQQRTMLNTRTFIFTVFRLKHMG